MYTSNSKFLFLLFFCGCSEYDYSSLADKSEPPEDTGIEIDIPVAVAGPSQRIKKFVPVQLDASASYHPMNSAIQLNYQWELTSDNTEANISFENEQSSSPTFSTDKIGTYVAELEVIDSFDVASQNFAATVIEVVPYEDFFITLEWDTPNIDLDLHVLTDLTEYYSDQDCFFGNPTPDWGELNNQSDDPYLVFDDEGSERKERFEFRRPAEKDYYILVHYYNMPELSNILFTLPKITIEAEGQVIYEMEGQRLTGPGQIWNVGRFDWEAFAFVMDDTITDHGAMGGPIYND